MTLQIIDSLLFLRQFSRSPDVSCKKVTYEGLDGDKNLYVTFLAASEFIQSAIEQVSEMRVASFSNKFCKIILFLNWRWKYL